MLDGAQPSKSGLEGSTASNQVPTEDHDVICTQLQRIIAAKDSETSLVNVPVMQGELLGTSVAQEATLDTRFSSPLHPS